MPARFNTTFVALDRRPADGRPRRHRVPAKPKPELAHGIAFFRSFRDLMASGFWTTRMGIDDLQYLGNVRREWNGCPDAALKKLGVSYPD